MLSLLYDIFKNSGCYCRFRRAVSLAVLITFSSSIISPAFASVLGVIENKDSEIIVVAAVCDIDEENVNFKAIKDLIDEKGNITIQVSGNATRENVGFLAAYKDAMPYFLFKEFVKKGVGEFSRSYIVTGKELDSVYQPSEAAVFARRSVDDLVRNIDPAIKKAKAKGDYKQAGKIIRNSLLGHLLLWPVQIGMGYAAGPVFGKLGLPDEVHNLVGLHAKLACYSGPFAEISGRTGETLLRVEHPSLQWLPIATNTMLLVMFYNMNLGGAGDAPQDVLRRLAISETASAVGTTAITLGMIAADPEYDKYEIFSFDDGKLFDMDVLNEIWQYGWPVFVCQIAIASSMVMDVLLVGMIGDIGVEALAAKKRFGQLVLLVNIVVAASSQSSSAAVMESIANNETKAELQEKMYGGLTLGGAVTSVYLLVLVFPGYFGGTPELDNLIRILAGAAVVAVFERIAKEELFAFKKEDQSWLKTIGDTARVTIPAAGVTLFLFKIAEPNVHNYRRIQLVNLLPAIMTVASLFVVSYRYEK